MKAMNCLKPFDTVHWGCKHRVRPQLVEKIFGDGLRLLRLYPMMLCPNHFIVRICSSWIDDRGYLPDDFIDTHLDEIYEEIEEEFDFWPWSEDYEHMNREAERGEEGSAFVDWNDGSTWELIATVERSGES